jgi:hypothetical protein
MQQQVEEAEVQVAALQAIVALQPLSPILAHQEQQQVAMGTKNLKPKPNRKNREPNRIEPKPNNSVPIRFHGLRNRIYRGKFGFLPRFTEVPVLVPN